MNVLIGLSYFFFSIELESLFLDVKKVNKTEVNKSIERHGGRWLRKRLSETSVEGWFQEVDRDVSGALR